MSIGTAFYPRQEELNRKHVWGEWSGYLAAQVYADFHDIEYAAIREAAAVIDTSPLYKYRVHGPDAGRLLDRIVTRNIASLKVDQVLYTPWCDEDGKVLDDGTVTRLADERVPRHRRRSVPPLVPAERHRPRRRGRGHQRVARRARAPGQAQPGGARGRDRRGLDRRRVLPASADGDRRRRRERHADRLHGRPRLRALDPRGGGPGGLGRRLRRRRALRHPPGGDPRDGRRPGRGRPDPDRGRVHERPARDRPRAELLAVRDRPRPARRAGQAGRVHRASGARSPSAPAAVRPADSWGSSSSGPASRRCTRSTASRR